MAELTIPAAVGDDAAVLDEGLVLHPIIMDGALQAAFDLLPHANHASLPLALHSLCIFRACAKEMFAWIRHAQRDAGHTDIRLDIDLCDRQGNVCVQMRGVAYEPDPQREQEPQSEAAPFSAAAPLAASREAFPAVSLTDAEVALRAPGAQSFAPGACAKPTEIPLAIAE